MQTIIVHDNRVVGRVAEEPRTSIIPVNASTPVSEMIANVRDTANRFGTDVKLKIMAHGYERAGELGYGLQICSDDITLETVNKLAPLCGLISYGIDIYSCGAAHTASWRTGTHGDGWLLCSRIASTTRSIVRAGELAQLYTMTPDFLGMHVPITFGQWEGRVITFDVLGREAGSQQNPAE